MFNETYTEENNDPKKILWKDGKIKKDLRIDPLGLRNCMRFLPHDDNQGGFFVAVFEKIHDFDDGLIKDESY